MRININLGSCTTKLEKFYEIKKESWETIIKEFQEARKEFWKIVELVGKNLSSNASTKTEQGSLKPMKKNAVELKIQ